MRVEIWSDYVCPFCYIGKRKFESALERFAHKDKLELVYRSFELDPNAPVHVDYNVHQMLANKYGMSVEQAKATSSDVARQAESVGLTYNFDTMVVTNTFDAHRLSHYAAAQGKAHEMTEALLYAYFTETKHIGDKEVLADIAAGVGLNREEAAAVLAGSDFTAEVRADEQEANALGVRGVPFFVINRRYAVSGAQSSEVFLDTLQKAWDEAYPQLTMVGDAGLTASGDAACVDGVCAPAAAPADAGKK
ncbi:DsbA family oxidoreductase [Paenibacillus sp. GCM10023252]|uniref:DsbA family oxidoreductase n=1 Tax=Paenibacillus sp. GCM10023252 TaxID=3252649 RepID=UPI0036232ABF